MFGLAFIDSELLKVYNVLSVYFLLLEMYYEAVIR